MTESRDAQYAFVRYQATDSSNPKRYPGPKEREFLKKLTMANDAVVAGRVTNEQVALVKVLFDMGVLKRDDDEQSCPKLKAAAEKEQEEKARAEKDAKETEAKKASKVSK